MNDITEYTKEVKKALKSMMPKLPEADLELFTNGTEAKELIEIDFNEYIKNENSSVTPKSTASCLYMLV